MNKGLVLLFAIFNIFLASSSLLKQSRPSNASMGNVTSVHNATNATNATVVRPR